MRVSESKAFAAGSGPGAPSGAKDPDGRAAGAAAQVATLLIVARDLARARPLHAALSPLRVHLVVTEDPAEARTVLRASPAVDVVLLEARSLARDGAQVIAAARELQPAATIVAFDDAATLTRGIAAGEVGDEVLIVDLDDRSQIRRVVRQALERTGLLRERAQLVSRADVTPEARLRDDERRLRARLVAAASEWVHTFDSVSSSIAVVDAGGAIQRVNRAARDLIDKPYADIVGRPLSAMPGEPWATALRLLEGGQPGSSPAFDARANRHWEVTLRVMTSGGEPADARESAAEAGRRWVMSAREVTQLIDLQASLGRARIMAAMGALVAEVAHEVRNPLFALSATLDVFEARFRGEPDCARYVEALRAQIGRMRHLMQDLLDFGKGVPVDRREPACFAALVAEAVGAAEPGARERAITIVQDDAPALPTVPANSARLITAIHNLVQNAIQHSPAGSVVRVSTRLVVRGERLVECSVSDGGPGFRDEDLPKIFLPFFTRRTGGTGLGLAIVQHIIESHEGTIEARNIPGGGAMITFRLPVEPSTERRSP